jgi:anti-sigma B factor antagonist
MSGLEVRTDQVGEVAVVHAVGEVDMSSAPTLLAAVLAACAALRERAPVVVDLSGVSFFGSSGLTVLVAARERCHQDETPLRVVATTRAVLRTLEISGLITLLDVRASLADATRAEVA